MKDNLLSLHSCKRQYLLDFQRFYRGLSDQRDIFYVFFTTDLLHWVVRNLEMVPDDVNLVLLGAKLAPEEVRWVEENVSRPFHHVEVPADDKTIWELLFQTNRRHFGWLDIDCFVLEPELFSAMADIAPDVLANCAWTYKGSARCEILKTYLVFMNVDVIRETTTRFPVSSCTYSFERARYGRSTLYGFNDVLTPEMIERLREFVPPGPDGKPSFISEEEFFDTLQVYQLLACSLGYRLHKVRPSTIHNDAVHVGKVSYYNTGWSQGTLPENREIFELIQRVDYLVLSESYDRLPERYAERWHQITREFPGLGVPTEIEAVRESLVRILTVGGMSHEAATRLVAPRR